MLRRDDGEAPLTKSRTIHEQVQRDHQGQHDIEDHCADLSQGAYQILQDVAPALFDGGGGLRLELIQVGLDAVLAQCGPHFGSARLQVVSVLRKCAGQITRLAHERACEHDDPADDHDADEQVDRHDGQKPVAHATIQHVDRSAEREGEHGRQGKEDQCVQDRADHLPHDPEQRHAGKQGEQDNECLLPVAVQQATSGQGSCIIGGRRFSARGVEFMGHRGWVNCETRRLRAMGADRCCCQASATFSGMPAQKCSADERLMAFSMA